MKSTETKRDTDLPTQLEDLFHQVWLCEAQWRFEQRLQLALASTRVERRRP